MRYLEPVGSEFRSIGIYRSRRTAVSG